MGQPNIIHLLQGIGPRRLVALGALLFSITWMAAQDKGFTATAPATVQAGQQFQYVIEGSEQGDVRLPSMDGFQLLAGPFSSYSSHSTWVNGKMTMETVVSYTHVFRATREGELTIPPAAVQVGRKEYQTNEVKVTVLPGGAGSASSGAGQARPEGSSGDRQAQGSGSAEGDSEPVFLRVVPSKRDVYVGEQLVSGLKVYTRVNTRPASSARDLPYEGFFKKSVDPDQSASRETIDGLQYVTQVIQRHILIPQKSGELVIEPYESEWMVQQQARRRSNSVFDSFFDDPFFNGMREVPTTLYTPPVTIRVKPLPPGAPEGFTGGVGDFTMNAGLSADEVEVNEALSLRITIRGSGNLPLLGEPEVSFPPDHDLYDVTRTVNTTTSGNRISGSVIFEYPVVARHAGKFRIAPVQFSWFDPGSGTYRTESTSEFNFTVVKGEGGTSGAGSVYIPGLTRERVQDLGTDIRDISRQVPAFVPVARTLAGTSWYIWAYPSLALAAILAFIWIRVAARRNADTRLVRNRKAGKLAGRLLKKADQYRKSGQDDRFYEAVGKALWGYVADKLDIETAGLTKDLIGEQLRQRGVSEELLSGFNRILDDSEFSRFAPSAEKTPVDDLYREARQLIRNLENQIK